MRIEKTIRVLIILAAAVTFVIVQVSCPGLVESMLRTAAPTFNLPDGTTDDEPIDVKISCPTEGSSIRYTLDGSSPTRISGTLYTAPIHLTQSGTIKAIAYVDGLDDSLVSTATCMIEQAIVQEPTFSPMANSTCFFRLSM